LYIPYHLPAEYLMTPAGALICVKVWRTKQRLS